MLFKNILAASCMALSAAAAATSNQTTPAAVQLKLVQLDLGFEQTNVLLDRVVESKANLLGSSTETTTADDIVAQYNATANSENSDIHTAQPTKPFQEGTQFALCNTFHSVALTGVKLNNAFADHADLFNKDQRNTLQEAFTDVNDDTGNFIINVASKALPLCLKTLQADESAISQSFHRAVLALDPSSA